MSKVTVAVCGPFTPDPDLPPDHLGRRACIHCNLMGRPNDPHHPMPDVPEQAEARHRVDPGDE
jgi:hypothetical protein